MPRSTPHEVVIHAIFWLRVVGTLAAAIAAIYGVAFAAAVRAGPRRSRVDRRRHPPVTILKPLCGSESALEACLRSFCTQKYPDYQVIFGVAEADDPALDVARRLQTEFDNPAIDIVVDPAPHGSNRKISNVINMFRQARFDTIVLADSDIRVDTAYLERVVTTLNAHPDAVVTCAYRAQPGPSVWSRLGALFVNEWFLPLVLISQRLGYSSFGFGATLALTRDTLERAGGFEGVADNLADDYALVENVQAVTGQPAVLSDYIVDTITHEPSFKSMLAQETRWMRTIRLLTPLSYFFTGFSFGLPAACAAIILGYDSPLVWALVALAVVAHLDIHRTQARKLGWAIWRDLWLLPLRGVVNALVWARGFTHRSILWRGHHYSTDSTGRLKHGPDHAPRK